jgi:hypothetical protein
LDFSALRRIKRMAFAVILFLSAAPVFSQTYDVVGLVQDEQRGEPIGQVEISLQSGKILGYTNSNGRFEIKVNSHNATLIFKRHTFKTVDLDLTDLPNLIGVEISMESDVLELTDVDTLARPQARQLDQAKSMEELELMQGMRIDLNDHLRQLPGVSGMNEFTNDISVWGSRTNDVTHYLGQSRIPSLRHLDIGFPGNQSVLNPRLLKSITVADNLAKGPMNQGNASALVYDLKDGDPNNIHGDVVLGTVNRELNLTGYWGGRTFLMSGRYLEPTFLSNLGEKFFTEPKDARLKNNGAPCDSTKSCRNLSEPFSFSTVDGYFGTFYRDSTGASARHSFILLDDTYEVQQDVSNSLETTKPQTLVKGTQDGWMYAYDAVSPHPTGDLQYAFGFLHRNRAEDFRDTLPPSNDVANSYPWFFGSTGSEVENLIGSGGAEDYQVNTSFQWNANGKVFGAAYGYGLDMEYLQETRDFIDISPGLHNLDVPQDYGLANALYRLKWSLPGKQNVDVAAGAVFVYQGAFQGDDPGLHTPAPLASIRYSRPVPGNMIGFGEVAIRQNTALEPSGINHLEAITTSSAEGKLGVEGGWKDDVKFTASLYSRFYKDPRLPVPEVYWNFEETHSSDYAYANGGNVTAAWLPSHHIGMNVNASVVQGDYHLEDNDGYLPWESNRSLDLVSNIRVVPRDDSLLSFIVTYSVNNGVPLYEYTGLYDLAKSAGTNHRTVEPDAAYPTVSRQRTDMRMNLDLKSHWRPLDGIRFFFEADNIFANANSEAFTWLGGDNRRRRGWTRANPNGDLEPVVTKGLGFFIMFGIEGRLLL